MKQFHRLVMLLLAGLVMAGCKQKEGLTQAGDINLAGCEVPAGITREAAEKIGCADSGLTAAPEAPADVSGVEMTSAPGAVNASALAADAANLGRGGPRCRMPK